MKKTILSVAIVLSLALALLPAYAHAEEAISLDLSQGSVVISENADGETVITQGENVIHTNDKTAVIRQSNTATATKNTIIISNGDFTVTLAGVNIDRRQDAKPAVSVKEGAKLTIMLVGKNITYGGVFIPKGATLSICGTGELDAMGYRGAAGIGGSRDAGSITINEGIITAMGGDYAAGIGGGDDGDCDNIVINDGVVVAMGDGGGAGIGGGFNGSGGMITINGGTITGMGSYESAGIGGGYGYSHKVDGGVIKITGGTVVAKAGFSNPAGNGAGLGCGSGGYASGGKVSIVGGNVTVSSKYGYAIGRQLDSVSIDYTNATITLQGQKGDISEGIFERSLQNEATAALIEKIPLISTAAHGFSGLTYQWQVSTDNTTWTDISEQTTEKYTAPLTMEQDGQYVRCKLINGFGNVEYTTACQLRVLAFSQQPQSVSTGLNDTAALSIASTCPNVSYRWERSYDSGTTWSDVPGETYATLMVNTTRTENGALYRCVIKASNGDELASDSAEITVTSDAVTYTTRYYLEKPDGSGYDLSTTVDTEAEAGQAVTAIEKSFPNFTENSSRGTLTGTVKADSSLVLSRYYDRNSYTLAFETNGGAALGSEQVKYGAALSLPTPSRAGYQFDGWYSNDDLTTPLAETTMPGNNLTLYAKWTLIGAGRGIEYLINGITLRDNYYQSIGAIPRGTFYAEVSVTNLSSTTTDTLVLAAYDKNGKFLKTAFLYANPPIGYTFVLGTSIDNANGEVAKLKALMLPVLGGLTPLAVSVELQ